MAIKNLEATLPAIRYSHVVAGARPQGRSGCTRCTRCMEAPYRAAAQKRFRSPPTVSTHNGLTYDRTNSSALQATTSRGAHGRVVVNDTTDLNKRLPVINDTTNLSEGLPVINDTSAKMTYVVAVSIKCLDNLCAC